MGNDSETRDTVRVATDATVDHLGKIAAIVATAVQDIASEISKWVDDVATARASAEAEREQPVATEVKPQEPVDTEVKPQE